MNKLVYAGAIALVFGTWLFAIQVAAEQTTWTWTVPAGVEKILVTSVRDDNTVLKTTLKVEPGQTFKLEVVE